MFASIVPQVLAKYEVQFTAIGDAQKGYRNESYPIYASDGDVLNLLFFKNEQQILQRIERADQASAVAASEGLPVRVRHDTRLLHVKNGLYAGLYNYLPGATVPWEAFGKKHIKLLGKAMADQHHTWQFIEFTDDHRVQDELLPLINRMETYFARRDVRAAMAKKLQVELVCDYDFYEQLVAKISKLDGQHIVHMDMVRGNVLFGEPQPGDVWQLGDVALTGVIDFEKAAIGHPLFDLARTLAFLLVDSPKPAGKIYHYFLDSGYHKRGGQPLPDARLLTPLVRLFLLHDFYKFLRHTPYEALADNYHYTRTRDLLKDYGMIHTKS